MDPYNQNYTREEIQNVLEKIKSCVEKDQYIIAQNENREENIAFIQEYNIRSEKQKCILLQLEPEDFCHTLQNAKPGYEFEVLYVFVPEVVLFDAEGEEKKIDLYIKINIIEKKNGSRVVVISFHRRNKPIDYLFR